jgi:hypothetical protein
LFVLLVTVSKETHDEDVNTEEESQRPSNSGILFIPSCKIIQYKFIHSIYILYMAWFMVFKCLASRSKIFQIYRSG